MKLPFRVLALALALAAPVAAQTPADPAAPGRLNAFLYREVPASDAFKVVPLDDSRENRRLASALERARASPRRKVDSGAALTLNFATEIAQVGRPGPQGTLGLAGGPRRPDGAPASVRYTLTATLEDARGSRLWQANATLLGTPGDEQAAYAAMARVVAEEIGKVVRQRGFRIE
jgi:predicted Zn-dependent protease